MAKKETERGRNCLRHGSCKENNWRWRERGRKGERATRRDARARFHTSFLHHHAREVAVDARSRSLGFFICPVSSTLKWFRVKITARGRSRPAGHPCVFSVFDLTDRNLRYNTSDICSTYFQIERLGRRTIESRLAHQPNRFIKRAGIGRGTN